MSRATVAPPRPPEPVVAAAESLAGLLLAAGVQRGDPLGLSTAGSHLSVATGAAVWSTTVAEPAPVVADLERRLAPRWVWWSSVDQAAPLVAAGVRPAACWDLAAVHRLLRGGSADEPAQIWALACDLAPGGVPASGQLDLLSAATHLVDLSDPAPGRPGASSAPRDADDPVQPDGYLQPGCWEGSWLARSPRRTARWAQLAGWVAERQLDLLVGRTAGGDARTTARAESAAALLSVELALDGLPLEVAEAERVIGGFIGPRPGTETERLERRRQRDSAVLQQARGASADLRNPAQVRQLLAEVGVTVPDTRSWRLEPFRSLHPVVEALVQWRKAERIETTYGYTWLDRHVSGDRLRGRWHASDGAAGRMTAQAGLHNLPAELRSAVAAPAGRVLVRADLGQIEPRVLAAVSADPGLATAAAQPDLYAPVAEALGVDRPTAKVAVLAAMYGQTSGAAGAALRGMDASYPRAMAYLRAADEDGRAGRAVMTYGGRRVPVWETPAGLGEAQTRAVTAARGRFTRNAVVQGAAAELFKAWAATVRLAVRDQGAQIVLCLHDELLVETPRERADQVAEQVLSSLESTAARWFGSTRVRFVADIRIVERWSDAKD
jgi:DNA polymerase-1